MQGLMTGAGFIIFLGFGILQIVAGYIGIDHHFGAGWAIAALVLALGFRFTLPITVGAFFGAVDVWGWHWVFGLLFALPGLLFVVPGILAAFVDQIGSFGKNKNPAYDLNPSEPCKEEVIEGNAVTIQENKDDS
jgi:hypothetical protein